MLEKERYRLAVLISNKGSGSNLKAVVGAVESGELEMHQVVCVVSDRENALGLEFARDKNIPIPQNFFRKKDFDRYKYSAELADYFNNLGVDISVLAGFMTILDPVYIQTFKGYTLNIHPGLIPDYPDKPFTFADGTPAPWNKGLMAESAVLNFLPLKYAGSSIHTITKEADFGPVHTRVVIQTKPADTLESLYTRLKSAEHRGLIETLKFPEIKGQLINFF